MHRKPKISIGSFALIVLSLSLFPLIACNTAIGRAIGGDGDGGAIEMPSPPESSVTYSVSGELNEPAPDEDEWTFEGPEGAIVELRMVTSPGAPGVDTYLVLNGPAGQQVTMNDDYEGLHAGINIALPSEGQYTIIAKGYGQSVGLYDLTVKFVTLEGAVESDGGPIPEVPAGQVSSSYGEIQMSNDEDVWEIAALTGDNLLIILDGITQLDPTLTLIDPDGEQVDYNDDFVGRDSQITHEAQSDGVYLAIAKGYGGRSVGDYYLNVTGNSERAIFNDITENLEQAQADLQAVNEVAAAAVVAELVDEAVQTEQQAAVELQEAEEAADIAEEAERTSAQADVELNNAEQAEAQAEEAVQELTDESSQLDQMVVQDISQLEEVSSEADLAAEANRIAEEEAAVAEAELERLRQEQAESARIAAAAEARLEAEREQAAAAAAAEAARLEEARTLERIQRNAAEAARVEAEAVAARVELAAREEAAAQAELAALAARLAEEQAEQELAEQAREAAEAEVAAAVAAEAARNAAGDSAMATIIQGGYVDVSTPQFGTASVVDGQIYYIHDGSSNPVDTFTATVRGTGGELFEVRMSVELSYVRPNTAPVAVDDIYSIQMTMATAQREAERRYEGPFDPVGNDMDGDGDSLVLTHLNGQAVSPGDFVELDGYDGSLSVSVCNSNCGTGLTGLMILPKHNYTYTGQDAFTYTVSDGNGLSSVGTVYVNLTTTYEPP
ncbi:MAG: Ig-like domain-containing protein, partial [Dehalococcoidia bacterium]